MQSSNDSNLAAMARKFTLEVKYHSRFSESWFDRLSGGTETSHKKMQEALDTLYPYANELTLSSDIESEIISLGIGANLIEVKEKMMDKVHSSIQYHGLKQPDDTFHHKGGKTGIHSEYFGYILTELQYMQRAYPNMTW